MNKTAPSGLVFDLDNTLLDRATAFVRVAEDFYDEHLRLAASATREEAVAMMVGWDADGYSSREGMLSQWLGEWPSIGMSLEALMAWYRSAMERRVEPDEDVNDFLDQLNERRVPWGIVTNGRTSQRGKCRAAGLNKLASFIIVSDEAGYAKPDPRIFRDALTATGLTTPGQVMFVGDNPVADIDGARRFGMQAAWIRRGRQYPSDLRPQATSSITSPSFETSCRWRCISMPIDVPRGPGGADRGKAAVLGDPCYLCEVIGGRADKGVVEETDMTLTLVNWVQFELGQVYVIPRRHAPTLFDLTDEEAEAVIHAVRRTADALVRAYDPDGLNLIQNNGVIAGQSAPHFHMHVVPRRKCGSDWGNGPPHIAAIEGKTPTRPGRDVIVSLEKEHEIARHIRWFLQ